MERVEGAAFAAAGGACAGMLTAALAISALRLSVHYLPRVSPFASVAVVSLLPGALLALGASRAENKKGWRAAQKGLLAAVITVGAIPLFYVAYKLPRTVEWPVGMGLLALGLASCTYVFSGSLIPTLHLCLQQGHNDAESSGTAAK